jgi:hypothetical protein
MPHIPVNHRLQPWYRLLAALAGAFVLVFGIIGIIRTAGDPLFVRGTDEVFGLKLNLAFSIISVLTGIVVLGGAALGRNSDHYINLVAGGVFLGAGMLMMILLRTDADFLNFRMATCIVSFVIGLALLLAGLYGKTASVAAEAHEEHFRLHHGADPHNHRWAFHGAPSRPDEDHPDGHRFA